MIKRGYKDGIRVIEIIDGNLDLVMYHDRGDGSFCFYRFSPLEILGETISRDKALYDRKSVSKFLECYGKGYDETIHELLALVHERNLEAKYDM